MYIVRKPSLVCLHSLSQASVDRNVMEELAQGVATMTTMASVDHTPPVEAVQPPPSKQSTEDDVRSCVLFVYS